MASGKTARRLLPFPKPTDPDKLCADIEALAAALDNDAETGEGTEVARTAAKTRGRFYRVSGDINNKNGILWWDTGSGWEAITPRTREVYFANETILANTSHEPTALEGCLVTVHLVASAGGQTTAIVKVGATKAAWIVAPASTTQSVTVFVPAGQKYEVESVTGSPTRIEASTVGLGLKHS